MTRRRIIFEYYSSPPPLPPPVYHNDTIHEDTILPPEQFHVISALSRGPNITTHHSPHTTHLRPTQHRQHTTRHYTSTTPYILILSAPPPVLGDAEGEILGNALSDAGDNFFMILTEGCVIARTEARATSSEESIVFDRSSSEQSNSPAPSSSKQLRRYKSVLSRFLGAPGA